MQNIWLAQRLILFHNVHTGISKFGIFLSEGDIFSKVILYIFSSIFLIDGGLGVGVGVKNLFCRVGLFIWWGLWPVVLGLLGFWDLGSLHRGITLGKNGAIRKGEKARLFGCVVSKFSPMASEWTTSNHDFNHQSKIRSQNGYGIRTLTPECSGRQRSTACPWTGREKLVNSRNFKTISLAVF